MYGVAGEKRPIFLESDASWYNLDSFNPFIHYCTSMLKHGNFNLSTRVDNFVYYVGNCLHFRSLIKPLRPG
jgi:hypothetical protein